MFLLLLLLFIAMFIHYRSKTMPCRFQGSIFSGTTLPYSKALKNRVIFIFSKLVYFDGMHPCFCFRYYDQVDFFTSSCGFLIRNLRSLIFIKLLKITSKEAHFSKKKLFYSDIYSF